MTIPNTITLRRPPLSDEQKERFDVIASYIYPSTITGIGYVECAAGTTITVHICLTEPTYMQMTACLQEVARVV